MCRQPARKAGQTKRENFLGAFAIEGGVGGAGRSLVIAERGGLQARVKLREAGGQELADLPAGQAFAACHMIEARIILQNQRPSCPRGHRRWNGTTKFVGK